MLLGEEGAISDNMRHFQYRLIHHTNLDLKKSPVYMVLKLLNTYSDMDRDRQPWCIKVSV